MLRRCRVQILVSALFLGCHAGGIAPEGGDVMPDARANDLEAKGPDDAPPGEGEAGPWVEQGDTWPAGDEYHFVPDLGLYLCMSQEDCPAGLVCVDRYCAECRNHSDCPSGYCRGDHTCVPSACQSTEDCVPYFCIDGRCVQCRTRDDCWPNEDCISNQCEVIDWCETHAECPEGYECWSGTCIQRQCNKGTQPFTDTCPVEFFCDPETFLCVPDICPAGLGICRDEGSGWVCKPDGSGFFSYQCLEGRRCLDGHCREVETPPPVCKPSCEGLECGVDGCGALCGSCEVGWACEDGQCVPVNQACFPREVPGCPGCACEGLVCKKMPECCSEKWHLGCAKQCDEYDPGFSCPECATILPAGCGLRECGVEPCGAFCGACAGGGYCQNGTCVSGVPPDMGRGCEFNGECLSGFCEPVGPGGGMVCTMGCGEGAGCPSGWVCQQGLCRVTEACLGTCQGKKCGVDECGAPCGSCAAGKVCTMDNLCVAPGDGCDPTPGVPTCGGCACQACVCSLLPACCLEEWSHACAFACLGPQCDPLGVMAARCEPQGNPCAGIECGPVWMEGGMLLDCGSCAAGWTCMGHQCVCQPRCEGRVCGPDGCGGWCGADASGNPPKPPFMGVFCEDGQWKFVPEACFVGGGPSCFPGPPGWDCMDYDCPCEGIPMCCQPGFWEQECVDYAMAFCGLDCDPVPWPTQE